MTRAEWVRLSARIMRLWPHQVIPDDALAEWYSLLGDLDAHSVNVAVTALATAGREFPPPAGVIRAKVAELADRGATFEECWATIHRAIAAHGIYRAEEAMAALQREPPAAELVLRMGGWRQVCLGGPNEYETTNPGVWRSQAEHAFRALAEQRRADRSVAELPGIRGAAARQRLSSGRLEALAGPGHDE